MYNNLKEVSVIIRSLNTRYLRDVAKRDHKSAYDLSNGITPTTVYKILKGSTDCRISTLIKLLNSLGIGQRDISNSFIFDDVSKNVNKEDV